MDPVDNNTFTFLYLVKLPRYVRVNTIKISTAEAIGAFIKDGFTKVDSKVSASCVAHDFVLYRQKLKERKSCLIDGSKTEEEVTGLTQVTNKLYTGYEEFKFFMKSLKKWSHE